MIHTINLTVTLTRDVVLLIITRRKYTSPGIKSIGTAIMSSLNVPGRC